MAINLIKSEKNILQFQSFQEQLESSGRTITKIIAAIAQFLFELLKDSPYILICASRTASLTVRKIVRKEADHHLNITDKKVLNVFVHGYWHDKTGFIEYEKRFIKDDMGSVLRLSLSSTLQNIENSAQEVFNQIQSVLKEEENDFDKNVKVNIIGHSMGGLVSAKFAQNYKDSSELFTIKKVVTLGSPFEGTWLARLGIGESAKQMRKESQFLEELIIEDTTIDFYAAATRGDQVIKPWGSCLIGSNQREFDNIGHLGLLFKESVIDWVVECVQKPATSSEV
ncbi:MAG: hypothetical protein K940chlam3_01213 [Chlamydiae bacterium]|nr:hypothetical protein [Chlamydiota bacterium]